MNNELENIPCLIKKVFSMGQLCNGLSLKMVMKTLIVLKAHDMLNTTSRTWY